METNSDNSLVLLRSEGEAALGKVFSEFRPALERMVRFRLDRRLWRRVGADDVLQEAYMRISQRLTRFVEDPRVPVFVWMRAMVEQTLIEIHRQHIGAQKRDASVEVSLHGGQKFAATSVSLAAHLAGDVTSPSQAAVRDEMIEELHKAFDRMDSIDREVLALRHFEGLGNSQVAEILGIQRSAASNRYIRALKRMKAILSRLPTFTDYDGKEIA